LLGAVMLAFATRRVETLREAIEQRPLKNLGTGALGLIVLLIVVLTLVVTLIGIPLAVLTAVGTFIAIYLAFPALPLAVGRRLVSERSSNPYVHLAVGCALLFVLLCIPVLGGLLSFVGFLIALGALVRTRCAGLLPKRAPSLTSTP
jgi:uncharacterized membrane protein